MMSTQTSMMVSLHHTPPVGSNSPPERCESQSYLYVHPPYGNRVPAIQQYSTNNTASQRYQSPPNSYSQPEYATQTPQSAATTTSAPQPPVGEPYYYGSNGSLYTAMPMQYPYQQIYLSVPQHVPMQPVMPHDEQHPQASPPRLGMYDGYVPMQHPLAHAAGTQVASNGAMQPPMGIPLVKSRYEEAQLGRRTKVSRACDECRRKKTRCDAEGGHDTCTPCFRSSVPCTFVRAQLRRGPTKKRGNSMMGSAHAPASSITTNGRSSSTTSDSSAVSILRDSMRKLNGNSLSGNASPPLGTMKLLKKEPGAFPALVEAACRQPEHPEVQSKDVSSDIGDEEVHIAHTPPMQYDASVHGVSHNALIEYYTFFHPSFPLLPDLIEDFDVMFRSAGPAKNQLVAALNTATRHDSPEKSPMLSSSLENITLSSISGDDAHASHEAHLITLLFTYLRTLDATWIGASVAAVTAFKSVSPDAQRAAQLISLVVVLDKLHCAVFNTMSLVPDALVRASEECNNKMRLTLQTFNPPDLNGQQQFLAAPQATLQILGKLYKKQLTKEEARQQLAPLASQLHKTPLEPFVQVL